MRTQFFLMRLDLAAEVPGLLTHLALSLVTTSAHWPPVGNQFHAAKYVNSDQISSDGLGMARALNWK